MCCIQTTCSNELLIHYMQVCLNIVAHSPYLCVIEFLYPLEAQPHIAY